LAGLLGMTVNDLAHLELPFASLGQGAPRTRSNMAGFLVGNVLAGNVALWRGGDLAGFDPDTMLLDVCSAAGVNQSTVR
jgi:hypothetical protein